MTSQRILFLALTLLLSACAVPVRVTSPTPLADSPETMGKKWRVRLGNQVYKGTIVTVTEDLAFSNPDTTHPGTSADLRANLFGGVSLGEKVDLEARIPYEIRGKWQFVGEPKFEAHEGNFSMAVFGGLGAGKEDATRTQFGGTVDSYNINEIWFNAGLSAGYRFSDAFMLFGGFHGSSTAYEGDYTSGTRSLPKSTFSGSTYTFGPNVGVEFGIELFQVRLGMSSETVISAESSINYIVGGAEMAFTFGGKKKENDRVALLSHSN